MMTVMMMTQLVAAVAVVVVEHIILLAVVAVVSAVRAVVVRVAGGRVLLLQVRVRMGLPSGEVPTVVVRQLALALALALDLALDLAVLLRVMMLVTVSLETMLLRAMPMRIVRPVAMMMMLMTMMMWFGAPRRGRHRSFHRFRGRRRRVGVLVVRAAVVRDPPEGRAATQHATMALCRLATGVENARRHDYPERYAAGPHRSSHRQHPSSLPHHHHGGHPLDDVIGAVGDVVE